MNRTAHLQTALAAMGMNPGRIDGIPGANTTAAVRRYQFKRNLNPTGQVDAKTLAALKRDGWTFPADGDMPMSGRIPDALTPWMDEARRHLGVAEIVGPKHSPVIMGWIRELGAKVLGIQVNDDETAWCGTFVGLCVSRGLPNEPLPAIVVRASAWENFGTSIAEPTLGAVLVFTRPGGGHVGFYDGEDATHYHVTGGNQGNKVSTVRLAKDRCTAIRWPSSVALPKAGRVIRPAGWSQNSTGEA